MLRTNLSESNFLRVLGDGFFLQISSIVFYFNLSMSPQLSTVIESTLKKYLGGLDDSTIEHCVGGWILVYFFFEINFYEIGEFFNPSTTIS